MFVLGLLDPVQTHAGVRRVQLQVKGGGLDRFLLVAGQTGQAVGEGIGDAEVHGSQTYFFPNGTGCFMSASALVSNSLSSCCAVISSLCRFSNAFLWSFDSLAATFPSA